MQEACGLADPSMVCVAEVDGRVVGFATYHAHASSRVGVIGNNAVRPDCQGQGIGSRMYEYVFDRLRELGMRCVSVETGGDDSHARARRAYARAGFKAWFPSIRYYRQL